MISSIANILGYVLNFIYNFVGNYGWAIIIFSVLIKLIMLPLSIKQQKTMKKTAKMQVELKEMQDKYKNNPEKLNQEMMDLYKRENMSPLSGCFSSIVQIILLFAVFYLVRSPLTYMKKVDTTVIEKYSDEVVTTSNAYPEVQIIKEKGQEDEAVYLNMDFLGLDLSSIPSADFKDYRVYIIPVLYVISSVVSMKLSMNVQNKKKNKEEIEKEDNEMETMQNMNKSMSYMMPIMAVSISLVAPLGLALYWLVNNILMIGERLILDRVIKEEEEA